MKGVLTSDIHGYKMNTHIITGGYANRVRNFNTYSAISKDIIHRWTYPMVPDNNWLAASSYQHSRPHIYKERNVKLAQYVAPHSLAHSLTRKAYRLMLLFIGVRLFVDHARLAKTR